MVDLLRYQRLKPHGLAWVESGQVRFKRFDNETGQEIDPEVNFVNIEELKDELDKLTRKVEACRDILNDPEFCK